MADGATCIGREDSTAVGLHGTRPTAPTSPPKGTGAAHAGAPHDEAAGAHHMSNF